MTTVPPYYKPGTGWEALEEHSGPWTEDDFNALPEGVRAELHDGNLILTPSPEPRHQFISRQVANTLDHAVGEPECVLEASDVRMADGRRYRCPDVIVVREPYDKRPAMPENVLLIVEIISPGGGDEWDIKMQVYAAARIPAYLIIEERDGVLTAWHHELVNGKYVVTAEAHGDDVLTVTAPFPYTLNLADLRRKRR